MEEGERLCFSKKVERIKNDEFSVEFLELKMNFDYSGPRLFYANSREPDLSRIIASLVSPSFNIQKFDRSDAIGDRVGLFFFSFFFKL